jgi:DNA-binding transcriptional regulator YiaG
MSAIQTIRKQLGLSQAELAAAINVSAGNVSHYEVRGQTVPPEVARRLIQAAAERGIVITFDDVYASGAESEVG